MSVLEEVKKYYGETLQSSKDLKTSACCPVEAMPRHIRPIVAEIHPEILDKFYGCGSPIPPLLDGMRVLDLGCGTGRDSYVFSKLVGETGSVVGVDMTEGQLAVATRHRDYHRDLFGYRSSNVEFKHGYIEDLATIGIADNSIDVVTSNCVLNLAMDKAKVFAEIFRVLKPGGELYFSDIFSGRRIPPALANDPIFRGECLGGALYIEDFRRLMIELGVNDFRTISSSSVTVDDADLAALAGGIDFYSMTIRVFKIPVEDKCEDYGQVAWYNGGIPEAPHQFALDDHHLFERGKPMLVCSNTARMLARSRFSRYFRIEGDESTHYGLFDCADAPAAASDLPGGCC